MRRRRLLISVGIVLGFMALVLFGLAAMARSDPGFYHQADMGPGAERTLLSNEAFAQYWQISSQLDDPAWTLSLSADQINAFFQEGYYQVGGDDNLWDEFHAPRVRIEDGKMRLGARWGSGLMSTVLSLEIKVWKVADETNTLAMEIISLQAGSLPLSTGMLLDKVSEWARREKIDISWYRQDGHPVAIMRFQADLSRPTFQFDRIELKDGKLTIHGRSTDPFGPPPPRVVAQP